MLTKMLSFDWCMKSHLNIPKYISGLVYIIVGKKAELLGEPHSLRAVIDNCDYKLHKMQRRGLLVLFCETVQSDRWIWRHTSPRNHWATPPPHSDGSDFLNTLRFKCFLYWELLNSSLHMAILEHHQIVHRSNYNSNKALYKFPLYCKLHRKLSFV